MFLRKHGSSDRNLTFAVIYSALQKSLRGNMVELALEMAKEFKEYPNALKKRLIQNCAEDCCDWKLIWEIFSTPPILTELVKFIPILCAHVKCREATFGFRVAVEFPNNLGKLNIEDSLLELLIKEKSYLKAGREEAYISFMTEQIKYDVRRVWMFSSKNRSILDSCAAYLKRTYTHTAPCPVPQLPETFDLDEIKPITIPDFVYDKHTGSLAKSSQYEYFITNMIIAPRMPETYMEKLGKRLYIERNMKTKELMKANPKTSPAFINPKTEQPNDPEIGVDEEQERK